MKKFHWVVLLGAVISGCATQPEIPVPDQVMAERSGVTMETLRQGHAVYRTECARCHDPIMPENVSDDDWHLVVPGMAWNAGISKKDEDAVMKYIMAVK